MINSAPTEKQIAFAEAIAYTLGIDFPTCSAEYTKLGYQQFISYYYNQWRECKIIKYTSRWLYICIKWCKGK